MPQVTITATAGAGGLRAAGGEAFLVTLAHKLLSSSFAASSRSGAALSSCDASRRCQLLRGCVSSLIAGARILPSASGPLVQANAVPEALIEVNLFFFSLNMKFGYTTSDL